MHYKCDCSDCDTVVVIVVMQQSQNLDITIMRHKSLCVIPPLNQIEEN